MKMHAYVHTSSLVVVASLPTCSSFAHLNFFPAEGHAWQLGPYVKLPNCPTVPRLQYPIAPPQQPTYSLLLCNWYPRLSVSSKECAHPGRLLRRPLCCIWSIDTNPQTQNQHSLVIPCDLNALDGTNKPCTILIHYCHAHLTLQDRLGALHLPHHSAPTYSAPL